MRPIGEPNLFIERQVLETDILAIPILIQFVEHSLAAIGQRIGVLAHHKVNDVIP